MYDSVLILGMHRSGTSCLTGCLNAHGLALGGVSNFSKYNKRGNQENKNVFRLNESLLEKNGGSWHTPPKQLIATPELILRRDELIGYYNSLDKPWGIKDPRMLLTFEFWREPLPNFAMVSTFRHPKAVAQSLRARDRLSIPLAVGYKLWSIYNNNLLKLHQKYNFKVINFDLEPEHYLNQVLDAAKLLKLNQQSDEAFFDKSLVTYEKFGLDQCPNELRPTYERLLLLSEE